MVRSYLTIDVKGDQQLKTAALMLGQMGSSAPSEIGQYLAEEMGPAWQPAVRENARTKVDQKVLADTAQTKVSGVKITLQSAMRGGKLSGGFPITRKNPYGYPTIEFGTGDRDKVKTYLVRTKEGGVKAITRHTTRQLPPRVAKGRVVYPTAKTFIPRVASLMVQTVMRTFYECFSDTN